MSSISPLESAKVWITPGSILGTLLWVAASLA